MAASLSDGRIMVNFTLKAPRLCAVVAALPAHVVENTQLSQRFGPEAIDKIIKATGIERRAIAQGHTVAGLGVVAAREALSALGWLPQSVGLIIVVTQTPDFPLPSTACLLQHRLGLDTQTLAFDLNLGCSGYVYGLSVAASLMACAGIKRALLVCGDITSSMIGEENRALAPLFGDAVTVTALSDVDKGLIGFDLGSDGSGAPYLMSQSGGQVRPGPPELFMDGTQVMAFSLKQVANSIGRALESLNLSLDSIDHIVLHQANAMMIKALGHKLKARDNQMVYAVKDYGNTSSASIGLAICDMCLKLPLKAQTSLVISGFGVGWSWASAVWSSQTPFHSQIVRVEN
jgi:3-oxoacyl-[acyl-carrier-protein] synthase III